MQTRRANGMGTLAKVFRALPLLFVAASYGQSLDVLGAVRRAEQSRDSVQAASLRLRQAEFMYRSATPWAPFRVETGYGTFPSIGAGEDFLLAQPIDIFGKRRDARGAAGAGVEVARAQYRQVTLDLQTEVMNAYAEVVSAQIQFRTGRQMMDLQQQMYDATRKRVDGGDLPPIELSRAELDLERAKTASAVNEQTLRSARETLSAAVGSPVTEEVDEAALDVTTSSGALRPDIQQFQAGVDSAKWEIRSAQSDRLPDFELQFRRDFWGMPEQYNFRGQLIWNVLDWGAGANRVKAAKSGLQSAQKDLSDRVKTAVREGASAEAEVKSAQTSVDSYRRLEESALSLVQKEQKGYQLGGNTLLDVLEATRALRDIQQSAADAKMRLLQAQAKLLAARGMILTESK